MSRDSLLHAIIEVTPHCNLKCRHCYNWWKSGNTESFSYTTYKKTLRLLNHLIKKTTVEQIVFTGGEPTLSERFTELVLHARVNRKKVTVITNGCGPANIYDDLINLKVSLMEFSIHSSQPDVHDRITGIPGSWKKATEQMLKMLQHNISVVPVIVITSYNHSGIQHTLQYFRDLGITSVMINRYNIGGEGIKYAREISAGISHLRTAFKEANQFAEKNRLRIVSGVCTPHCILNPDDYPAIRFGSCSGNYLHRPLTFDPEGNVRLCNHSPVNAGNIYCQPFSSIFSSTYMDEWSKLNIPFCKNCNRLERCKAGCRAASEQIGLPLTCEDPLIKELGGVPFTL